MNAYLAAALLIGFPVLLAVPGIYLIAKFAAEAMADRLFEDDDT